MQFNRKWPLSTASPTHFRYRSHAMRDQSQRMKTTFPLECSLLAWVQRWTAYIIIIGDRTWCRLAGADLCKSPQPLLEVKQTTGGWHLLLVASGRCYAGKRCSTGYLGPPLIEVTTPFIKQHRIHTWRVDLSYFSSLSSTPAIMSFKAYANSHYNMCVCNACQLPNLTVQHNHIIPMVQRSLSYYFWPSLSCSGLPSSYTVFFIHVCGWVHNNLNWQPCQPDIFLSSKCCNWFPSQPTDRARQSKKDQFLEGSHIYLGKTNNLLCPPLLV